MSRFDGLRRRALVRELVAPLRGRRHRLLPFDEVRDRLQLRQWRDRGLVAIPLDRIVGSLDRPDEFDRAFLPRHRSLRQRWEEVARLAEGPRGFPPIEVYQVGDSYFVVDGHHRVSVARTFGADTIEGRVREFLTPLPVDEGLSVDELLRREGLADFLLATGLEPDEFASSAAHTYDRLLDHIAVHRYFLGEEKQREVSWHEAVSSWLETVYRPVVAGIEASGLLALFPRRTATDLYLFTMERLHQLRQESGDDLEPTVAVDELSAEAGPGVRLRQRLRHWLLPSSSAAAADNR